MTDFKAQLQKLIRATIYELLMAVLGLVWMILLIVELAYGLNPFTSRVFNFIWAVFIFDFVVRFFLAASKTRYIRRNWLVGISLLIPALRLFRIFRLIRILRMVRVLRGIQFARIFTSFRRSVKALGATMHRRGFGYVAALTVVVVFSGAAGMYAFERHVPRQQGFNTYSESVWWTAMLITTMGSQFWPATVEGRLLCLLLSIYAVTMLGYIAATLASYFIDRDAAISIRPADLKNLQDAVDRLNDQIKNSTNSSDNVKKNTDKNL